MGWTSHDDLVVLKIKGIDVLGVRRTSNGLAIFATVFSEDGKIVAQIIDNRFYVNPNNFFKMERPNAHSLVVYDLQEKKVLDVSYINSHSVKVSGTFHVSGGLPVVVDQNQLLIGGNSISDSCFEDVRVVISVG